MTNPRKPNKNGSEAFEEISQGLGGLLGALGETLNKVVEAAEAQGTGEAMREHTIETPIGPFQARAGVTLRMGGIAQTNSENSRDPAEPIKSGRASSGNANAPRTSEPVTRAPLVDVYDSGEAWNMTAEVPGVTGDDLSLEIEGDDLVIAAEGTRAYLTRVKMPAGITLADIEVRVNNGILHLKAARQIEDGGDD